MRATLTLPLLLIFGCQTSPQVSQESQVKTVTAPGVLVSLERTPCFGACPVYRVEVLEDGLVRFKGERHVKVTEPVQGRLEQAALEKLTARLDQSGFAQWKDFTRTHMSDMPTVVLTYKGHTVRHSLGDDQAPPELTQLEDDVDALLGTERWIKDVGVETK